MRRKKSNRWRRIKLRPEMAGYTEADLPERLLDRRIPALTPADRAAIEPYARLFADAPRRPPGPGRPQEVSDAACVRLYLGGLVRGIGHLKLARVRTDLGPGRVLYMARKGKRLLARARAQGLLDGIAAG